MVRRAEDALDQYQSGDRLLFIRDTRYFAGSAGEIAAVLPDGLQVRGAKDRTEKIRGKHRGAFDVGRPQMLPWRRETGS